MRTSSLRLLRLILLLLTTIELNAQVSTGGTFTITQAVIASGGGSGSSGGVFKIDGTIGQPAAGSRPSDPTFSLENGFWLEPTAMIPVPITVSGKVTTPFGQALRNVVVTLIDPLGVRQTATTSSFGLYSFANVAPGNNYVITVTSKRYRFAPLILSINSSLANVDFTGLE